MAKTLIFGATGNLVSTVADILFKASPMSLRVATSRETGLDGLRQRYPGVEVVRADWNDRASLIAAMVGVSRLLVVTPQWGVDDTLVTPNIIAAAQATGSIELVLRLLANPPGWTVDDLPPESQNQHVIAKPLLDASGLPVCYVNVPVWIMFNLAMFVATEVKAKRRIALPTVTDRSRMWLSEFDIAAVMAKILSESATGHVGQEYVLTSAYRYTYVDVARIFSEQLGTPVAYVEDDAALRESLGGDFDAFMTYFRTEKLMYAPIVHRETIAGLLDRPQQSLEDYITSQLADYG